MRTPNNEICLHDNFIAKRTNFDTIHHFRVFNTAIAYFPDIDTADISYFTTEEYSIQREQSLAYSRNILNKMAKDMLKMGIGEEMLIHSISYQDNIFTIYWNKNILHYFSPFRHFKATLDGSL